MTPRFDLIDTLAELTQTIALAGREQKMIRLMKSLMGRYADAVHVDAMGNVIATVDGSDADVPALMVFAHMDQLGLLVRKIEPDGFLRIERLGGIPEKSLLGQRVIVESDDGAEIPGVIGAKSHHVTPPEDKYKVPPYQTLYVDIGAASRMEVEALGIQVGAGIAYAPAFDVLNGRIVSATSLDNRAGCAVLLRVLENLREKRPQATVYVVGTVQEEFNLRGALPAARTLLPNFAICLDLVVAADTPDLKGHNDIALGAGPAISLYSFHGRGTLNGLIPHPAWAKYAMQVARENTIVYQPSVGMGVLTDASYVQLVGEGIPTLDLAYPCRYTHSPIETAALADLEALAAWVTAIARSLTPEFALSRE